MLAFGNHREHSMSILSLPRETLGAIFAEMSLRERLQVQPFSFQL